MFDTSTYAFYSDLSIGIGGGFNAVRHLGCRDVLMGDFIRNFGLHISRIL